MDVVITYTNENPEEDIYISQAEGFLVQREEDWNCQENNGKKKLGQHLQSISLKSINTEHEPNTKTSDTIMYEKYIKRKALCKPSFQTLVNSPVVELLDTSY